MSDRNLIAAVRQRCERIAQSSNGVTINQLADALGYIGLLVVSNAERRAVGWPAAVAAIAGFATVAGLVLKLTACI